MLPDGVHLAFFIGLGDEGRLANFIKEDRIGKVDFTTIELKTRRQKAINKLPE